MDATLSGFLSRAPMGSRVLVLPYKENRCGVEHLDKAPRRWEKSKLGLGAGVLWHFTVSTPSYRKMLWLGCNV